MPARVQQRPVYRNTADNRYRNTTAYITDGNTVRVARPQQDPWIRERSSARPQQAPHPRTAPRPQQAPRHREAVQTASISITFGLTMMLVAAVVAALYIGYSYLCLKSSLDTHMNSIKALETSLESIRTENDALERSIDTSVDLNHVYQVAVNELGMVRAGQNNIIQYDKTESEYVRQYEDIPATN